MDELQKEGEGKCPRPEKTKIAEVHGASSNTGNHSLCALPQKRDSLLALCPFFRLSLRSQCFPQLGSHVKTGFITVGKNASTGSGWHLLNTSAVPEAVPRAFFISTRLIQELHYFSTQALLLATITTAAADIAIPALLLISTAFLVSIAVRNAMTKSNFGREDFLSAYNSQGHTDFSGESQGRNSDLRTKPSAMDGCCLLACSS